MSICIDQVNKRYWIRDSAPRTLQQAVFQALGAMRRGTPLWALRDISFDVRAGEAVALIGHNGSGKSTLLRLLCGIGRPTSGRVSVEGRVAALLDLGAGFHPNLSGRENLYVSAVVAGLRRSEVDALFERIVDFAEIAPFIDQPLRTYSAGMLMRLAFAVAIHVDPDVLIIDEALAVGDSHFQQKCLSRIQQFRDQGKTLLLVSHEMAMVRRFCDRVIWLDQGRKLADGPAETLSVAYEAQMQQQCYSGRVLEIGAPVESGEWRVGSRK